MAPRKISPAIQSGRSRHEHHAFYPVVHAVPPRGGARTPSLRSFPPRRSTCLRVDEHRGLVEVQASTPWKAIAAALHPATRAPLQTTMTYRRSEPSRTMPPDRTAVRQSSTSIDRRGHAGRRAAARRPRHAPRRLFALVAGGRRLHFGASTASRSTSARSRVRERAAPLEELSSAHALRLLVPPEKLDSFLAEAHGRCGAWRMPLAGVEARRTLAENDSNTCAGRRTTMSRSRCLRRSAGPRRGGARDAGCGAS